MNNALTIFSVTHKNHSFPECDFIKPIQVNKQKTGLDLGFMSDDTGDNIASKNENYSELTALYWIWKNLANINSGFIGLCHYRRYFTLPIEKTAFQKINSFFHSKKQEDVFVKPINEETLKEVGSKALESKLIEVVKNNQIVVAKEASLKIEKEFNPSIKNHYIFCHLAEEWKILEDVILEKYPDYSEALKFLSTHKQMHCYNMFVGNKKFIEDYCSWVFNILFEVENKISISKYPYQQRVLGFMAERLLNLYLHKNNIQKFELPVVYFE